MGSQISGNREKWYHDKCEDDGKARTPKLIKDDLGKQDRDEGEGGNPNKVEGEVLVLKGISERLPGEVFPKVGGEVDQEPKVEESIGSTVERRGGHLVTLLK